MYCFRLVMSSQNNRKCFIVFLHYVARVFSIDRAVCYTSIFFVKIKTKKLLLRSLVLCSDHSAMKASVCETARLFKSSLGSVKCTNEQGHFAT